MNLEAQDLCLGTHSLKESSSHWQTPALTGEHTPVDSYPSSFLLPSLKELAFGFVWNQWGMMWSFSKNLVSCSLSVNAGSQCTCSAFILGGHTPEPRSTK